MAKYTGDPQVGFDGVPVALRPLLPRSPSCVDVSAVVAVTSEFHGESALNGRQRRG